jgi:hypothetical protein
MAGRGGIAAESYPPGRSRSYHPGAAPRRQKGTQPVSFIQRAREAAETAAAKAQEAAAAATRTAQDPSTAARINRGLSSAGQGAKEAAGFARKSMNTIVERIDPATLAELIVKATALQEMTNKSLRSKGSPYRISEISIAATIPPGVTFAIARIDDEPEALTDVVLTSEALLEAEPDAHEVVLSLDGTTVDEELMEPLGGSDVDDSLEAAGDEAVDAALDTAPPPTGRPSPTDDGPD